MNSRNAFVTVFTLVTTVACADLKDLVSLQQGLSHEFQTSAVNVNLHDSGSLTVIFSNSPSAALPEGKQAVFARRVAEYVRDHYAGYSRLQSIHVGFATIKGGGGFQMTNTQTPYQFTPSELGEPQRAKDATAPKAAA